jgi:hypothetical protein
MIITLDTLVIDQDVYEAVRNFTIDMGLMETPDRDEMFFLLRDTEGVNEDVSSSGDITYFMDDIKLEIVEANSGDGNILIATGYSPAIEELYKEMNEEEPDVLDVVIASAIDTELHDVSFLNAKIHDYFPIMKFSEIRTRYETQEDVEEFILDGKSVDL